MRGVNKVILIGNLGSDPDVKSFNNAGNNGMVSRVSIATSDQWFDKQTGERREHTEWHRVVFFGRLAEIAGQYLRKGRTIYVEGKLRTNRYTDQNGIERFSTEIHAENLQMLGTNPANSGQDMGYPYNTNMYPNNAVNPQNMPMNQSNPMMNSPMADMRQPAMNQQNAFFNQNPNYNADMNSSQMSVNPSMQSDNNSTPSIEPKPSAVDSDIPF